MLFENLTSGKERMVEQNDSFKKTLLQIEVNSHTFTGVALLVSRSASLAGTTIHPRLYSRGLL